MGEKIKDLYLHREIAKIQILESLLGMVSRPAPLDGHLQPCKCLKQTVWLHTHVPAS